MKNITDFLMILVAAMGVGLFFGGIVRVVNDMNAIYYWDFVIAGLFIGLCAMIWRSYKGYSLQKENVFLFPLWVVMGIVGLPNVIHFLDLKDMPNLSWIMTIGAFSTLCACGFMGTKN